MFTSDYDIAVIGAGIHGAAIAYDAALRGFSVIILDKRDIGSGASAGNYRIIHGGLRYLQHFDLPRLFESADEQKTFRKIAPNALTPLPFLIPCYGYKMRGREILEVGLTLYDLLTVYRNSGVASKLKLPWHESISKSETLEKLPYLETKGLRGGVIYYDAQMLDPDRLTLSFIATASRLGAKVKNYTELVSAEISQNRINKLNVKNSLSGAEESFTAKLIVNATGAWREQVSNKLLGLKPLDQYLFSKGLQITLPPISSGLAVALESKFKDSESIVAKGNRSYFLQPWRGGTIAGTADILHVSEPDKYSLSEEEINYFLNELKEIYPDPQISRTNVKAVFGGLRPVTSQARTKHRLNQLPTYGSIEVAHRDTVIDHRKEVNKVENLISVEGIKYTTTRRLAERVVNLGEDILGERRSPCKTKERELVYSPIESPIADEVIRKVIKEEFVVTLEDLIERRLGYGGLQKPNEIELERIKKIFFESKVN